MVKQKTDWIAVWAEFIVSGLLWALYAWLLMLLVGVLHGQGVHLPALGFWPCAFTAWVLSGLSGYGNFNLALRIRSLTPGYGKKKDAVSDLLQSIIGRPKV